MFTHLDPIDQEVISAIQAGKTDGEIMEELGVSEDKVVSMHGHLAQPQEEEDSEEVVDDTDDLDIADEIASDEVDEDADEITETEPTPTDPTLPEDATGTV